MAPVLVPRLIVDVEQASVDACIVCVPKIRSGVIGDLDVR
jgi:hypothetical protein